MKCADVERVLPELLDSAAEGGFPTEVENHLESCSACSELISDLETIAGEARQLAASEEPPARVWVRIAAELRAEGLIREPDEAWPILVTPPTRARWSAWWLAPVAAALLAVISYTVSHKPAVQVAKQTPAAPVMQAAQPVPAPTPTPTPATPAVVATAVPARAPQVRHRADRGPVEAPASAEDEQFLSAVSTRAPSMRTTYENQLKAVNDDIRETEAYVKLNPGDLEARQHLMDAYQQKALLYQIGLERIQ